MLSQDTQMIFKLDTYFKHGLERCDKPTLPEAWVGKFCSPDQVEITEDQLDRIWTMFYSVV
jgi:hypothetical protein